MARFRLKGGVTGWGEARGKWTLFGCLSDIIPLGTAPKWHKLLVSSVGNFA